MQTKSKNIAETFDRVAPGRSISDGIMSFAFALVLTMYVMPTPSSMSK